MKKLLFTLSFLLIPLFVVTPAFAAHGSAVNAYPSVTVNYQLNSADVANITSNSSGCGSFIFGWTEYFFDSSDDVIGNISHQDTLDTSPHTDVVSITSAESTAYATDFDLRSAFSDSMFDDCYDFQESNPSASATTNPYSYSFDTDPPPPTPTPILSDANRTKINQLTSSIPVTGEQFVVNSFLAVLPYIMDLLSIIVSYMIIMHFIRKGGENDE